MIFTSMKDCVQFLEKEGELVRISAELDPNLEMAELHNRIFEAEGPAILFEKVKGSPFPAVSNIFGTYERALKILEPELSKVSNLIKLISDPSIALKSPINSFKALTSLIHALPLKKQNPFKRYRSFKNNYKNDKFGLFNKFFKTTNSHGSVLDCECKISDLPMIRCWPKDGGGFILLPQVFSAAPDVNGDVNNIGYRDILRSNLGMYRIQLSGGEYVPDREIGLHYQIHRGISSHHKKALEHNKYLPVTIFIGGPPAHTLAAVMPLPEGMPEVAFAGALSGRAFRYALHDRNYNAENYNRSDRSKNSNHNFHNNSDAVKNEFVLSLDADFCITGRIVPNKTKPEGPFGDHLGYYSLTHQFPYIEVDRVFHRKDAVYPFTVVGRPPQEDSVFGKIIHEITAGAISYKLPGVTAIHAVDASGVHPLLLAKAMERYAPFYETKPRELLTHANAILGTGQLSLAKYLIICSHNDNPELNINDEMSFFSHVLERVDFTRDIHFQTCTTMDTLDYSYKILNEGSKVIIAAAGGKKRGLLRYFPSNIYIPEPFSQPKLVAPGIVVVKAPKFETYNNAQKEINILASSLNTQRDKAEGSYQQMYKQREIKPKIDNLPLWVIVDDSVEAGRDFAAFLWITFSRSNPSDDIYGVDSFTSFKHWGCKGSLIIDARIKPFHAPPLVRDPLAAKKIDSLAKKGCPLYGI